HHPSALLLTLPPTTPPTPPTPPPLPLNPSPCSPPPTPHPTKISLTSTVPHHSQPLLHTHPELPLMHSLHHSVYKLDHYLLLRLLPVLLSLQLPLVISLLTIITIATSI
ncbi:unnamed protein product, partial [Closterium sp. NIES-54]